jgi:hypothetical protein
MMKKYFLLTTIVFVLFSCAKTDGVNSEDNTGNESRFLQKFNGVVWVGDESSVDDSYYLSFYKSPKGFNYWEVDTDGYYCFPTIFDKVNEDEDTVFIKEENELNLLLSIHSESGVTSNYKFTVMDNGSTLKSEFIEANGGREIEYWTKSSATDPCK